jgi:hypothetical protein
MATLGDTVIPASNSTSVSNPIVYRDCSIGITVVRYSYWSVSNLSLFDLLCTVTQKTVRIFRSHCQSLQLLHFLEIRRSLCDPAATYLPASMILDRKDSTRFGSTGDKSHSSQTASSSRSRAILVPSEAAQTPFAPRTYSKPA